MEVTEINSSNLKDYQHLDIIAFSFAAEGAQGEGGSILMMTSDGKLYHTNYVHSITWEEALILCPTLKECLTYYFAINGPAGWCAIYLGGGNYLVAKEQYEEELSKDFPLDLYSSWPKIMHENIKS